MCNIFKKILNVTLAITISFCFILPNLVFAGDKVYEYRKVTNPDSPFYGQVYVKDKTTGESRPVNSSVTDAGGTTPKSGTEFCLNYDENNPTNFHSWTGVGHNDYDWEENATFDGQSITIITRLHNCSAHNHFDVVVISNEDLYYNGIKLANAGQPLRFCYAYNYTTRQTVQTASGSRVIPTEIGVHTSTTFHVDARNKPGLLWTNATVPVSQLPPISEVFLLATYIEGLSAGTSLDDDDDWTPMGQDLTWTVTPSATVTYAPSATYQITAKSSFVDYIPSLPPASQSIFATFPTPTYSSSNTAVATVNPTNGLITIQGAGTTTINANHAGFSQWNGAAGQTITYVSAAAQISYNITVNPIAQAAVTLSPTTGTVQYGSGGTVNLTAGGGSGNGAYVFSVSPPDMGTLTGMGNTRAFSPLKAGTATVQVYREANGGYLQSNTASSTITITKATIPGDDGPWPPGSTITKPTGKTLTYNTSAQTLITAGTTNMGTLQYKLGAGGTWSASLPTATNAGTYTIYYKLIGDENHEDYEFVTPLTTVINKANQAAITVTAPASVVYPNTITVTASGGSGTGAYNLVISAEDIVNVTRVGNTYTLTPLKAGTISILVTKDGDDNYLFNDGTSKSVTVQKKPITEPYTDGDFLTKPTGKTLTYNTSAQDLVTAGSTNMGTLQYKIGTGGTWNASLPTATNAGTYTIYYKIVGDENHEDFEFATPLTTVINKATQATVTLSSLPTVEYGQTLAITASGGSGTGSYNFATTTYTTVASITSIGVVGTLTPLQTGAATINVIRDGDSNYLPSGTATINITITKATIPGDDGPWPPGSTLTKPVGKTLTYNGQQQQLITVGTTNMGILEYKIGTSGTWSTAAPQAKNAGTYDIYYRLIGNSDHEDYEFVAPVTTTISKATIPGDDGPWPPGDTITKPIGKTLIYNGQQQQLITTGTTNMGVLQYKIGIGGEWSILTPEAKLTGTYVIYYRLVGDSNHEDYEFVTPVTTTISKATIPGDDGPWPPGSTLTKPVGKTLTYNDQLQQLITFGSTNMGYLEYKLGTSGTWSTAMPQAKNAGMYDIYYRLIGDSNHNDYTFVTPVTTFIQKAGIPGDDGPWPPGGTLTKPVGKNLIYNGQLQQLITVGTTNMGYLEYKIGVDGTWSTATPEAKEAGKYDIYYRLKGDNDYSDYEFVAPVTAVISKAGTPGDDGPWPPGDTLTKPIGKMLIYNGQQQQLITVGTTNMGVLEYKIGIDGEWSTAIPEAKEASTYNIYYRLVGDSNHEDYEFVTPVRTTIFKAVPPPGDDGPWPDGDTLTKPIGKTLTYNGLQQTLITLGTTNMGYLEYRTGLKGEWSMIAPQAKKAGEYDIYYRLVGDSNHENYTFVTPVKATILKATVPGDNGPWPGDGRLTKPTGKTLKYNGKEQKLIKAGKTNMGVLEYRLGTDGKWSKTVPKAKKAGEYDIYYRLLGDSDHSDYEFETPVATTITSKKAVKKFIRNDIDAPKTSDFDTFAIASSSLFALIALGYVLSKKKKVTE